MPEILASVGGMIKIFNIIFFYVNLPFCEMSKVQTIINNFFENPALKTQNSMKRNITNRRFVLNRTNSILCLQNINESCINSLDINYHKKLFETILAKKKNSKLNLKLSLCEQFLLILRKVFKMNKTIFTTDNNNIKIFENGEEYIVKYFDVMKIINNLYQLEMLKKIFLSEQQIKIFGLIKPYLENENKNESYLSPDELTEEINKFNFYSEIDQKLLKFLI